MNTSDRFCKCNCFPDEETESWCFLFLHLPRIFSLMSLLTLKKNLKKINPISTIEKPSLPVISLPLVLIESLQSTKDPILNSQNTSSPVQPFG